MIESIETGYNSKSLWVEPLGWGRRRSRSHPLFYRLGISYPHTWLIPITMAVITTDYCFRKFLNILICSESVTNHLTDYIILNMIWGTEKLFYAPKLSGIITKWHNVPEEIYNLFMIKRLVNVKFRNFRNVFVNLSFVMADLYAATSHRPSQDLLRSS